MQLLGKVNYVLQVHPDGRNKLEARKSHAKLLKADMQPVLPVVLRQLSKQRDSTFSKVTLDPL